LSWYLEHLDSAGTLRIRTDDRDRTARVQHTVHPDRTDDRTRDRTPAAVADDKERGSVRRAAQDLPWVAGDRLYSDRHAISIITLCCDGLVNLGLRGFRTSFTRCSGGGNVTIVGAARP
jgi:hypothetical protein